MTAPVDRALDALAAFTITDRETATVLLDTWSGRHQLNPTDRATVLDHYPSSNGSRPRAC